MNEGRTVFAQRLDFLPKYEFDKRVARYCGNFRVRKLPAYEHFLVLAFAQLTWRESLRDIETCLASFGPKLYHAGIRQPTARSTLANANEKRDWRIFADFAHILIRQAATLYADEPFRFELRATAYPVPLRRIGYRDPETGQPLVCLTNNFTLPALTITQLYRGRWQIELFFKWLKQHLRIKAFYGTTPNAVRTQIWSAIAVYLLVAILKKRLHLDASLYTILQILSLTLFEKMPISQALAQLSSPPTPTNLQNHQCLLGF